jgi:predicted 3-demethylubiquinone-9 3-methyltransferase (glyoxalase superfamily)
MRQINISWDYPAFWIDNLEGFVLYRDGIEICATSDPLSRRMVCEINVGTAPIYFTMTAYDTSGNESRLSESFVLQPPAIISESDVSDTSVPQAPTSSDAIIIDNGDSASRSIGSWNPSTGLNSYGTQSVFTKNPGSEYIFEKTLNGSYEVSLWWTVTASRCSNVPVEIYDNSTLIDTVYVDQNMDGGTWNILGVYDFYGSGAVSIVSQGGCSANADAVKFQTTASESSGNQSGVSETFVLQPSNSSDAIIIDNGDYASRSIGSWNPSTGLNSYGTQSVFTKNPGSEYIFEKTLNGSYEVSLWWTVTASRCSDVPVEIYNNSTLIDTVYVDQNMDGGTWNILGVYDFYGSGAVSIVSQGGCSASADAVKFQTTASETFVLQPSNSSDAIIIDNGDSASRSIGSWNPSTGLNSYGTQSVFTKNHDFEYIFEKTLNGSFEVSLWWTVTASRCSNVPVEIYDGSTLIDTVYVDQNMDGGTWNILGVYDFYGSGAVSIVSNGGCSTSADAVKFQQ